MGIAEDIEKLSDLRQRGAISDQEFQEAKARLLAEKPSVQQRFNQTVDRMSSDDNMWAMAIHLSQFCGYIAPLAGMIVPIVIWQIKKKDSEVLDRHGRIVANWILTELILAIIFGLLMFVVIGIPLLIALSIVGIVFPILGAIKANNGEPWPYPCSFKFFTLD